MKAVAILAVDRARAAWGDDLPAWVLALAIASDATSQAKAAKAVGYSPGRISQVLNRSLKPETGQLERAVRGAFMGDTVNCPALRQELPAQQCVAWQRRPYDGSNHQTVRMFLACRDCPNRQSDADAGGDTTA
ncbi:hypothetical protein ACQW02_25390 [Humitalea sp. 24SJ18S-53]|uniref:hypothetical protein n=1 Tax=Humitalea sp. 24SJ18S-53 TaxID=3422307 RepID=UPI003D675C1C